MSQRHLSRYLAEFCYRSNRRFWGPQIFSRMLINNIEAVKEKAGAFSYPLYLALGRLLWGRRALASALKTDRRDRRKQAHLLAKEMLKRVWVLSEGNAAIVR